jgi:hypothetical protein
LTSIKAVTLDWNFIYKRKLREISGATNLQNRDDETGLENATRIITKIKTTFASTEKGKLMLG